MNAAAKRTDMKYDKCNTKFTVEIVQLDDKVILINFWCQSETYTAFARRRI